MSGPPRGLNSIKTAAGARGRGARLSSIYSRILTLELEHERRAMERENAMRRVSSAEIRMKRIEAELAALRDLADSAARDTDAADLRTAEIRDVKPVVMTKPDRVRHRY
ncbi:MAG: hypothetical protein AAGI30_00835 [Planctomycetota bacterium]